MADHLRKQIREAAVTALTNLTTTQTRVYESRVYPMQDDNLPGLRVYTRDESIDMGSLGGAGRTQARTLELVVEACAKSTTFDDVADLMQKEVEVALAANQGLGAGVKYVQLRRSEDDDSDEAEKPVIVRRMTFEVLYYTALAAPDVPL